MAATWKPEDVPDELVAMACGAAYGGVWAFSEERYIMARALAAVLPAHEGMVREQVAKDARQFADQITGAHADTPTTKETNQ